MRKFAYKTFAKFDINLQEKYVYFCKQAQKKYMAIDRAKKRESKIYIIYIEREIMREKKRKRKRERVEKVSQRVEEKERKREKKKAEK